MLRKGGDVYLIVGWWLFAGNALKTPYVSRKDLPYALTLFSQLIIIKFSNT
jgi:hypothetical protein